MSTVVRPDTIATIEAMSRVQLERVLFAAVVRLTKGMGGEDAELADLMDAAERVRQDSPRLWEAAS